jgi:hypothetical protein
VKSSGPESDRGWSALENVGSPPIVSEMVKPGPLLAAELRPPPTGLSYSDGVDEWIDLHHAIGRMVRNGIPVLLTDNAVGAREEENLTHLAANLGAGERLSLVVPFLTTKHELQYCLRYADRAHGLGFRGVTVVGGDRNVGPPRCVSHAYELREALRAQGTPLQLGGWANPHRSAEEQAGFISDPRFSADFVLTQIVSHHSLNEVRSFLEALGNRGVGVQPVFGVFYYRSAHAGTIARLGEFFPVPAEGVMSDFAEGLSPEEICSRTILRLREVGVEKMYVSNLPARGAAEKLREIREHVRWPA